MGIENMPINCMECPALITSKMNVESARHSASNTAFDTQDDISAESIIDLLESKISSESVVQECEKTYETVSNAYEMLSRLYGCLGRDTATGACGLENSKKH